MNVHAYVKWEDIPVPVNVKVYSLKDKSLILERNLILEESGDEKTVCRFTLDSQGKVLNTNYLPKDIVRKMMRRY